MPDIESAWRENRSVLVDVAFRMLGNMTDAEDTVQEAFSRLLRSDLDDIEDIRGWLVVVVGRICLDVLKSARHRREERRVVVEDLGVAVPTADPADRITLDDNVRLALMVVLEKLSPAERAVFVLHEVFRYPYETVASIVGRTPAACRKLASRAREHIDTEAGGGRFAIDASEHRAIAERFIGACAGEDMSALLELLDENVSGEADLGPGLPAVPVQVGRDQVMRNLLVFFGPKSGITMVPEVLNGTPAAVGYRDGQPFRVLLLTVEGGAITKLHGIQNPARVAELIRSS